MTKFDWCMAIACLLTVLLIFAVAIAAKEDDLSSEVRAAQIIAEAIKQPVKCE